MTTNSLAALGYLVSAWCAVLAVVFALRDIHKVLTEIRDLLNEDEEET